MDASQRLLKRELHTRVISSQWAGRGLAQAGENFHNQFTCALIAQEEIEKVNDLIISNPWARAFSGAHSTRLLLKTEFPRNLIPF